MRAVLGLGSNLGSREALLRAAADLLNAAPGVRVTARSRVWHTSPVGPAQPEYLNAALALETDLAPEALLALARDVEARLGRVRRERWGARTLDVDLLWLEGRVVDTPALCVPHPELLARAFALGPLLEVAPDARDPRSGESLALALPALDAAGEGAGLLASWAFTDDAPAEVLERAAGEAFVIHALDRADLLACLAEKLCALGVNPAEVSPRVARELTVPRPAGGAPWSDVERAAAWLDAVRAETETRGLALRRAVVLDDGDDAVRAVLLGEARASERRGGAGAARARHAVDVGVAADGRWRAQLVVDD